MEGYATHAWSEARIERVLFAQLPHRKPVRAGHRLVIGLSRITRWSRKRIPTRGVSKHGLGGARRPRLRRRPRLLFHGRLKKDNRWAFWSRMEAGHIHLT